MCFVLYLRRLFGIPPITRAGPVLRHSNVLRINDRIKKESLCRCAIDAPFCCGLIVYRCRNLPRSDVRENGGRPSRMVCVVISILVPFLCDYRCSLYLFFCVMCACVLSHVTIPARTGIIRVTQRVSQDVSRAHRIVLTISLRFFLFNYSSTFVDFYIRSLRRFFPLPSRHVADAE